MGKKKSLKSQLTHMITLAFAAMAVLLIIFDGYLILGTRDQFRQRALGQIQKLVDDIEGSMENVDSTLTMMFLNNPDFETMSTKKDGVQSYGAAYDVDSLMQSCLLAESGFRGYLVFYDGGEKVLYRFVDSVDGEERTQIVAQIRAQVEPLINLNEWMLVQTEQGIYYAKVYQRRYGSVIGLVSLMDYRQTPETVMGMMPEFILADSEEILAGQELVREFGERFAGEMKNSFSWEDSRCYVVKREIGSSGLTLSMVLRKDGQYYFRQQPILVLIGSAGILACLLVLMRRRNKQMIGSLMELKGTMEKIKDNDWDVDMTLHSDFSEIEEVNAMFQQMMAQIRRLKIDSYEEKIKKQKAELTYFQLQIRPHFYLNCLKTMNALVAEERYEKIQDLILAISAHMRYLLKMEKDMVTLQEELDYTKNYLNLQNDLLERRAVLSCQISEDLGTAAVPLLTIQTFAENSFKYFQPQREGEALYLSVKAIRLRAEDGDYLDLTIRDNGAGYPEEVLSVINGEEVNDQVGVGITNLKNRCTILYQGKAEYNFYNSEGAVSELILPVVGARTGGGAKEP